MKNESNLNTKIHIDLKLTLILSRYTCISVGFTYNEVILTDHLQKPEVCIGGREVESLKHASCLRPYLETCIIY
jgi:hypothetical protein